METAGDGQKEKQMETKTKGQETTQRSNYAATVATDIEPTTKKPSLKARLKVIKTRKEQGEIPERSREGHERIVLGEGTVEIIPSLDAEWAELLLSNIHPNQRQPRAYHVAAIARALREGKFQWTADPVRLDRKDQLIDGQHRLLAVKETGIPLKNVLLITLNDEHVAKYLDTGSVPRSFHDISRFHGDRPIPKTAISAIVFEARDFRKVTSAENRMTKVEQYDTVMSSPFLQDAIDWYKLSGGTLPSGPLAGAIRVLREVEDKEAVRKFFGAAFSNTHYIDGDFQPMVKLLSDWLMSLRAEMSRRDKGRVSSEGFMRESADKAIRAWNAYRTKAALSKLQRGRSGEVQKPVA